MRSKSNKIALIELDKLTVNCVFCLREIWPDESACIAFFEDKLVDPENTEEYSRGWSCGRCYQIKLEEGMNAD